MDHLQTAVQIASIAEPGDPYLAEVLRLYGEPSLATYRGFLDDLERGGAMPTPTGYSPAHPEPDHAKHWGYWRQRMPSVDNLMFVQQQAERRDIRVLIPNDGGAYPQRMAERLGLGAPRVMFIMGDANTLHMKTIAMVGARAATGYGEHVTRELTNDLVQLGWGIASGAAYGIDGAAHSAALAAEGSTVAFLAGGVSNFYPERHGDMLDRMANTQGCAVVSELPPGFVPTRWRFLGRNRLIAATSEALVVVEAGVRSGSLNAAGHARSIRVPVGAVPGPITSVASSGTHKLIREGATLVTTADEIATLARP